MGALWCLQFGGHAPTTTTILNAVFPCLGRNIFECWWGWPFHWFQKSPRTSSRSAGGAPGGKNHAWTTEATLAVCTTPWCHRGSQDPKLSTFNPGDCIKLGVNNWWENNPEYWGRSEWNKGNWFSGPVCNESKRQCNGRYHTWCFKDTASRSNMCCRDKNNCCSTWCYQSVWIKSEFG